jgi:two-component system osmolarity sensor histidine kinase EnvZ
MLRAKDLMPRTLFGRSLLIIVSPLILLQVLSTIIFYERHWDTVTRRLAAGVAGDIAMVIQMMSEHPTPAERKVVLATAATSMDIRAVLKEGKILPNAAPPIGSGILDTMLKHALVERVRRPFHMDTRSYDREIEIKVQLPEGVLEVITSRERLFSSTTYIFVMWMVGSSLVLFAVAGIFMRNQVRPIRRLAAAADAFGKGLDAPDFRGGGATEVRQAATAFQRMRNRIQRQFQQRTEMLAGVSHDLRTPLTRMKLQLAMLEDNASVEELKSDISEMERMLDGYLAFARGEGTETPVATKLNDLLEDVASGARRQGGAVDLHCEGEMEMPLRPNAFKRCIANLVANAIRYGEHAWIRAGRRQDAIEVTIDDDGPGIPDDRREEVFKPFYRLDDSRNVETGGIGLGLTIANEVVHAHGGELSLADSPYGGLRVLLRLPL